MAQEIIYEIIDHGIIHPSYFQGQGVAFTDFDFIVTGSGDTYNEALADALDLIAQNTDTDISAELTNLEKDECVSEKYNDTTSAAAYERTEISNQITPTHYTDCPLKPGTFCEHCHALAVEKIIENSNDSPLYHLSILYVICS